MSISLVFVGKWTNEDKEFKRTGLLLVVKGRVGGFHFLLILCEELW